MTETTLPVAAAPDERRIAKTVAYYVSFIALGLAAAVLGPTLPGLAVHTGTAIGPISFLFTAKALGYLLGSLGAGWLYDRVRGHPVLAGMLGLMAVMLVFTPMIPWLGLLALVILLLGAGEGVLDVGVNTLLLWVHGRSAGPYMNGLHFFFGLGAFLAPVILAQAILWSGDINWAYWMLAILALPAIPLLLRLPSPQHSATHHGAKPARINWLLVALLTLFFFFYVGAEGSFGGWIFTYTTALHLTTPEIAAYLTALFWGALTAGRLLSIPLAARFSHRSILFVDLLIATASVGAIILWPGSLLAVGGGTLGAGLGMASIFPTLLAFAERRLTVTAGVSSWFFVGSGAGGMVLPALIGQLFERIGPSVTMYSILASLVVLFGLLAVLLTWAKK
ncbi:MAG: MFS transporter [Anaerolineae bacterium]